MGFVTGRQGEEGTGGLGDGAKGSGGYVAAINSANAIGSCDEITLICDP